MKHPHSFVCSIVAFFALISSSAFAQATAPRQQAPEAGLGDLSKYPGLLPEIGRMMEKFQRDIQFPPDRTQSDLLPLLPPSTVAYFAFPNYGDAAQQALAIFRQEVKQNPDLRAWWTHGEMLRDGPKIESFVEHFSQISSYLGDEVVVCGALNGKDPEVVVVAQVRKPGLRAALQKLAIALPEKSKSEIHILDLQELAVAKEKPHDLLVLVRPDFLVASTNLSRLRSFNAHLDSGSHEFVAGPFAQRILHSYNYGVSLVGAVDVEKFVALMPKDSSFASLQRSGFADAKYAVWERRLVGGQTISQAELSFTGPRHGPASWLGAPASLTSLDFVSQKPVLVASFVLNNPPKIFDDIQEMSAANQKSTAQWTMMEQMLGVSLKNDILAELGGEITLEVDSTPPAEPVWKAILRVKDIARVQQTVGTMLNGFHLPAEQYTENGVTYHVVRNTTSKGTNTIAFAFLENYLVIASSPETLTEAMRLKRSGDSLGKSRQLQLSMPGNSSKASALIYYDTSAMMAARLQSFGSTAAIMSQIKGTSTPAALWLYGDTDAIREASNNPGLDAGAVLIGAAVAMPALLRSRTSANESAAVGNLRTINTAQLTYKTTYSDRGYAPDLATLGHGPGDALNDSADYAGLLSATLANHTCTAGNWCTNSGYRFAVKGRCGLGICNDFVAVATPVTNGTGTRTFCSTADGIIRAQVVPPLTVPPTVRDCKMWRPLQ